MRGNEIAEPLKGFQQNQKADAHRHAVSQRVSHRLAAVDDGAMMSDKICRLYALGFTYRHFSV